MEYEKGKIDEVMKKVSSSEISINEIKNFQDFSDDFDKLSKEEKIKYITDIVDSTTDEDLDNGNVKSFFAGDEKKELLNEVSNITEV